MRTRQQTIKDLIEASDFKDSEIVLNIDFIRDLFNDAVGQLKDATKIIADNKRHRAHIKQLKAASTEPLTKGKQLEEKCRQLERERDALLKYITDSHWAACDICKHDIGGSGTEGCNHIRENGIPCFEWRGVKEE